MKYRKKPVVIEAIQWAGNYQEVCEFVGKELERDAHTLFGNGEPGDLLIDTLEGKMEASPYDFIIKGVNGEFYPCKPDIFEKIYEAVE